MPFLVRARAWLVTLPAKARVVAAAVPARAAAAVGVLTALSVYVVPLLPGPWAVRAAGFLAAAVGAVQAVAAAVARVTPILFPSQKGILPTVADTTSGQPGWFHVADGLYFRRAGDGTVEIGRGPDFDHVQVLQRIDPSSWGSVVSSVSAQGENHTTYFAALDFHQREPTPVAPDI